MFGRLTLLSVIILALTNSLGAQVSYKQALASLEEKNLPIVMVLGAEWCKYCEQLKEQLITKHDAGEIYLVYVDKNKSPENFKTYQAFFNSWQKNLKQPQRDMIPQTVIIRKLVDDKEAEWSLTAVIYGSEPYSKLISKQQYYYKD